MSASPSIFVHVDSSPEVWVRVEGKGTFQNSPGLKEFSSKMMAEGRRRFVIDLKDCPTMDSTFMGALAAIALRLKAAGGGNLWVVNQNQRNSELLAGLGIDSLFSTEPAPSTIPDKKGKAVDFEADKILTREVMREAHEACVSVNPDNEVRFRDVLEFLRGNGKG